MRLSGVCNALRGAYMHCVKTVFNRRIAARQALKKSYDRLNRFLFPVLSEFS
jgi:hypothetical protein